MVKKVFSLILTITLIITLLSTKALATEFSDMPDNWSTAALEHAVSNGLLNGENEQIMPDDNLTRAQLAAIINRAFASTEKADLSGYSDVHEDKWYYDDMAKAVQMGIFTGYDNNLNPDNSITRQEVFVVLARAFKLSDGNGDMLNGFEDAGAVSSWAVGAVSALIEAGYVNGNDGKINPLSYITRAEFAQLMYNMAKVYISTEGTYTSISAGNVIINTPDVTLKDINIAGDLIIGDGVGDGNVTLDNVNVSGRLVVRGGGLHTIKILGTSNLQHIIIARVDGQVRVYTEDGTVIGEVIVDGKDDVLIEGSVGAVTILANDVTVTTKNATVDDAVIEGENSRLVVESDSTIGNLSVNAVNTKIEALGQITDIVVNEEGADISGDGRVETVLANADNVTVTTENTLVTAVEGTTGVKAGTKDVAEGTTENTTTHTTGTGGSSTSNGYSVSIDQSAINATNETALSFTFSSAEVGTDFTYSIDDTNAGTAAVTGNGTIATATDQISGIDVSGLEDDTLTLTVTITGQTDQTDTVVKDATTPSGYSVSIDQSAVNSSNETAISFTFSSAEVDADYTYSIDDTNGGTSAVTGSGTIATATAQISGIDVSGLDDDTLTLTVYLTDSCGNQGGDTTDTITKDTIAPSGYSVSIDQGSINAANDTALSFTFAGAEVGTVYAYTISDGSSTVTGSGTVTTATDQIVGIDVSGLGDGTLSLSVTLTDTEGNAGTTATDSVTKETVAPSGYSVNFDQSTVIPSNETSISFTFASAEVGADYTYSIDDTNGGTMAVTGSGTIATATDQISGIDVSGLDDDTLTLTVYLTDSSGNQGSDTTDTVAKDTTAPSGYSVSIDQSAVNSTNDTAMSFTFSSAEVGADYTYSIDDTNGGTTAVTGSGTIATATDQISGIDVSGLNDDTLTLTVYLTDSYGNQGGDTTDTVTKETIAPSGYSVSIDQSYVNSTTETAMSFTFSSAEVGADYTYSIDDTNGGTSAVTGSGTIATATDQISGIDVSGLDDDTLTLTVYLTDSNGNQGGDTTDTVTKETVAPNGYSANFDQSTVMPSNETSISFTFASAEVGADYTYSIDDTNGGTSAVTGSGTIATATDQISGIDVSGLDDDTLTLTVYLTDGYGNQGGSTTDTVTKDTTAPTNALGYPKADTATTDGFTVRSKINEAGTAFYVVVADGASAPTAAEVKAGTASGGGAPMASGSIALAANTEGSNPVSGLTDGTAYDVYVVCEDSNSNLQSSATKVDVTTTSAIPSSLIVSVTGPWAPYTEAGTYEKEASLYNGKPQYHYNDGFWDYDIYWDGSKWVLDSDGILHYNNTSSDIPPTSGWTATDGTASMSVSY